MVTIQPKGEKLRLAVKWISDILKEEKKESPGRLIQDASNRFNLSPKEEMFLVSFYAEKPDNPEKQMWVREEKWRMFHIPIIQYRFKGKMWY